MVDDIATCRNRFYTIIYTAECQGPSDTFDTYQAEQDSECDLLSFKQICWLCLTNE